MKLAFAWWAPWSLTRPWLPRAWIGCDEWHNRAVSVVVPFVGAFNVWRIDFPRVEGGEHLHTWQNGQWFGVHDVACPVCTEVRVDVHLDDPRIGFPD